MVSPAIEFICPTCKKQTVVLNLEDLPSRPFCSSRCKMLDLYRWLNEEIVLSEPISPSNSPKINLEEEPD
jgi:endogenous inhibitor of DNA gyrase (YacG/DUF329 family)